MSLWKRASGALKDQNSLWIASLAKRTSLRNPEIETAVIKATSHDEFSIEIQYLEIIFKWIRLSSSHLKPVLWAVSIRMEKTRSWVVAIKGLMLMHGILACKLPAVQKIGRLPFDLSTFKDGHSKAAETRGLNTFVRFYYTFLDQKSTLLYMRVFDNAKTACKDSHGNCSLMQQLWVLQKVQGLLDLLLQIRPQPDTPPTPLVLETMDGVVIEIFDVYSRICSGIARVLLRIHSAGKVQAAMALRIVQKATLQGEELSLYFDICREIGVMNATECPRIEKIPEEDILELENIVNRVTEKSDDYESSPCRKEQEQKDRATVLRKSDEIANVAGQNKDSRKQMRTIITHEWETFEEDWKITSTTAESQQCNCVPRLTIATGTNPFLDPSTPLPPMHVNRKYDDLPDLISF